MESRLPFYIRFAAGYLSTNKSRVLLFRELLSNILDVIGRFLSFIVQDVH